MDANDKILALAAPPLLDMLYKEKEEIVRRLINEYSMGVTDLRHHVGNLALTEKMIQRIQAKVQNNQGDKK